ncbi:unnamed protein product [Urochloa decumbens]|uniref:Uncharacterized protein n=1 Tax=Urochloa decumbens TaxID=240449 RepID=A0ABC9AWM3_9POAL
MASNTRSTTTVHSMAAAVLIALVMVSSVNSSTSADVEEICYGHGEPTASCVLYCDLSCRTRFDDTYRGSACKTTRFQECCCYYKRTPYPPTPGTWQG